MKRTYYTDCDFQTEDSDDMNEPLYDIVELHEDLEEEYERVQNVNFAARYRQEAKLGFLATLSSQHDEPLKCRNCSSSFPSKNKLHDHLQAHCQPRDNCLAERPIIVKSAAPASPNLVAATP